MLKSTLLVLLVLVGLPAGAFLAWDAIAFQPWLPEIRAVLARADPEDRAPPAIMRQLIDVETRGRPEAHIARRLVGMQPFARDRRSANQHTREILWYLALKLHLDEEELHGLYATLAWNGRDHGLDRHARRAFGRSLSALDDVEAATVMAITRGPSYYANRPDRLRARRDWLLARLRAQR
jgi:hypothetical protein